MRLDELERLWKSNVNGPSADERRELTERFTARLRRRRRQDLAWLVWTFIVLSVLTVFVGWIVFGTDKMDLSAEWASIPLLLVPWSFAVVFLRRFLRDEPIHRGDVTIRDSLTMALTANARKRTKLKTLGVMYAIVLPVLAMSVWQLHSVGKVSGRELVSMGIFFGTALTLGAGAVLAKYWISVVPEGRKITTLLAQFAQGTE